MNIATGDIITYHQCATFNWVGLPIHARLSCSSVTDSICYAIATNISSGNDMQICRIDFNSLSSISILDPDNEDYLIHDLAAVNDDEVINALIDNSAYDYFIFYRYNFTGNSFTWSKQSSNLSKCY